MAMKNIYTVPDAAKFLNTSENDVRALAKHKAIPAYKIGRSWVFERVDLERFKATQ